MGVNIKIERLAKSLSDSLTRYLSTAVNPNPVVKSYASTDGDLCLTVTRSATDYVLVRYNLEPVRASGQYDSLGLAQTVYTPHITKLGFDSGNPGVQATETVTLSGVVGTDKLTIAGHDFTAVAGVPSGDQFHVGLTDILTATNLAAAINASVTAGIAGIVTASNPAGTATVVVTAVAYGTLGNSITVTQTGGHITVPSATLLLGTNPTASNTSDYLKTLVISLVAPTSTALIVQEKAGIAFTDMSGFNNLTIQLRNLDWGILAQI